MKLKDLLANLNKLYELDPDIDIVGLGTDDGIRVPPLFIHPVVGSGIQMDETGKRSAFIAIRVPK